MAQQLLLSPQGYLHYTPENYVNIQPPRHKGTKKMDINSTMERLPGFQVIINMCRSSNASYIDQFRNLGVLEPLWQETSYYKVFG